MTNYKQLGQEQRYVIDRILRQGKSQKEIAGVLGCHKSTISRELNRNTPKVLKEEFEQHVLRKMMEMVNVLYLLGKQD